MKQANFGRRCHCPPAERSQDYNITKVSSALKHLDFLAQLISGTLYCGMVVDVISENVSNEPRNTFERNQLFNRRWKHGSHNWLFSSVVLIINTWCVSSASKQGQRLIMDHTASSGPEYTKHPPFIIFIVITMTPSSSFLQLPIAGFYYTKTMITGSSSW